MARPPRLAGFFRAWSPAMAYVLGYWWADGYMRVKRNTGAHLIQIASIDREHLLLMANAVSGMVFKSAVLSARKAGKGQEEYLKITLENVLVTSYQSGGSTAALPVDQFSLNFDKITVMYRVQNDDGSVGAPVTTTFKGGC